MTASASPRKQRQRSSPSDLSLAPKSALIVYEGARRSTRPTSVAAMSIFSNQGQVSPLAHVVPAREGTQQVLEKVVEPKDRLGYRDRSFHDDRTTRSSAKQKEAHRRLHQQRVERQPRLWRERSRRAWKRAISSVRRSSTVRIPMKIARGRCRTVLSVLTFKDEDKAFALANNDTYGLAAWVVAPRRPRHARRAGVRSRKHMIDAWGAVGSMAPYGGYKPERYGREIGFSVMRKVTQEKRLRRC